MCGIAGILEFQEASRRDLAAPGKAMLQRLARRGPDDWGSVLFEEGKILVRAKEDSCLGPWRNANRLGYGSRLFLGQQRLSIIDLSLRGHQPMASADGRYWIVFNGEIYNYRQLRQSLTEQGVSFQSDSDTEVLLSLYAQKGAACLGHLRGPFAFAIWDEEKQELFLARDRFGMKPLYYAETDEKGIVFASEIKAVLLSGSVKARISEQSRLTYLQRGSIEAPDTAFENIRALEPGTYARINRQGIDCEAYWRLEEAFKPTAPTAANFEQASTQVLEALSDSMQAHQVSDVPVGLFLSGGIDSAALLAAGQKLGQKPLDTFSVVFPGWPDDESAAAARVARHFGAKHHEVRVSYEEFQKSLDEFFDAVDQPSVDGLNTFLIAKMAHREGIKVALSGLGGDEIFGGYPSFWRLPRAYRMLRIIKSIPGIGMPLKIAARLTARDRIEKAAQIIARQNFDLTQLWFDYRALFPDRDLKAAGLPPAKAHFSQIPLSVLGDLFSEISYLETSHYMIPQLLRDTDNFTLCHGLELRTPFVDHLFLEAMRGARHWEFTSGRQTKKEFFSRISGFLPPGHADLPKRGFGLPLDLWIHQWLEEEGEKKKFGLRDTFRTPWQQELLKRFEAGKLHYSRIWAVYVWKRYAADIEKMI